MSYAYFQTPRYNDGVKEWIQDARAMMTLHETLAELSQEPFKNPLLQTHRLKGRSDRKLFITDVDGRKGWRLIWDRVDRTIVLLLFGAHDKVERQAERLDYSVDDATGAVHVVEYETRTDHHGDQRATADIAGPGRLMMAWTDETLEEFGFTPAQVHHLRPLDTLDELDDLRPKLGDTGYHLALNLIFFDDPEGDPGERQPDPESVRELVESSPTVRAEKELSEKIASPRSRESFARVPADELADVLTKPIEDWMVFLHPDQLKLTQRPFSGPARVRGAAGTGKTVVAMHRARHLARTYPDARVLFTTYVNNLPLVFETLFKRFAPDEAPAVEFRNIHSWAYGFLRQQGRKPNIDTVKINSAYADAWRTAASFETIQGNQRGYLQQEIEWVIKGRGLTRKTDYLSLARTGRGTPFRAAQREDVWRLYERYQSNLRRAGVQDFADTLIDALALVDGGAADGMYTAVVIDEAQDLTEVGIRLLHKLGGGDRRDGLFLVGDGQQSIYPGGFSLASVGIDVRGRSALLKTNYRNTKQILAAASQVVEDVTFDDGDDRLEQGKRSVVVTREGAEPTLRGFDDQDDHDQALVMAISEVTDQAGVDPGDVAVLVPTNRLVKEYETCIRGLGMQTQKLGKYDGVHVPAVKVGTFQRAKGLEFKHVFLPRLEPETLGETKRHNEDDDAHAERVAMLRRQLFVAMTRARDGVWGGWVGDQPSLLSGQRL